MLIMANTTNRQHNTKIKSHATSKNGQKERRQKQKEIGNGGRVKSSSERPVIVQREEEDEGCTLQCKPREEDSASDLSDSERYSVFPAEISPPDLELRAEVIDPSDFQSSRPPQDKFRGSYPDFLPPPFNSWSLKQLAVYLNTNSKSVPRPKPVGKLERYLDRLLQIEWHQIQSVQEDSSKSNTPMPKVRHSSSHLSLSSPKCILQCQRAFPLALLSSLATRQLSSSTCPQCQNQYLILNGSCRPHALHLHTRLEKKRQASRSSSESRALESRHRSLEHRLSDPLSESRPHPLESRHRSREHRLSDPLSGSRPHPLESRHRSLEHRLSDLLSESRTHPLESRHRSREHRLSDPLSESRAHPLESRHRSREHRLSDPLSESRAHPLESRHRSRENRLSDPLSESRAHPLESRHRSREHRLRDPLSESRAHPLESRHRSREHRLSDPLSESSHWRRMQAVGNIRNPVGFTRTPDRATAAGVCDVKTRRPGERSHSCVGVREISFSARGRSERGKSCDKTLQDSKLSCAASSEGLLTYKDSETSPLTRKQKHVAFVTM
ncbi:uncharacterized protein fam217bb isoform X2 [Siphateles boraxobius]